MNERTRERELAERRALALKKLAKVFGTNGGDTDDGRAAHTAEKKILLEILRSTREPDVVGLVRDRLAVLSARDDSDESDEDYDVKAGEPGAGYDRRNPKPADPRDAKTVFSKQWTAAALREIAKGARDVPPATLASGAFWEKLLVSHAPELEHLRCSSGRQRESNGDEPEHDDGGDDEDDEDDDVSLWSRETLSRSIDSEVNLHSAIVERGYAVLPRPEFFLSGTAEIRHDAWTETLSRERMDEKKTSLDDLADATDALRTAGWPPVALFAFDAAWRLVDRLFPVAAAALDVDVKDVLLEPTVFAWALSVAEEDEEKSYSKHAETMKVAASVRPDLRDAARGASLRDVLVNGAGKKNKTNAGTSYAGGDAFSKPHRDYSAAEAWSNELWSRNTTGCLGKPNLVCVWVPLTDATLDTGCLHVVPRTEDRLFDDPDHPDHLRPAQTEADGGHALRFPVGAARAIPAEAGSVCLWAGQTIHYGSPCRLTAKDLDKFEGEDPVSEGVVRARDARGVSPAREPRRRRPRRSMACTFRVARDSGLGSPEIHEGGALPYLSRSACRRLTVAQRVRLIAQSLVLYSRWYDLPAFLPGLHDAFGFAKDRDKSGENASVTDKTSFVSASSA